MTKELKRAAHDLLQLLARAHAELDQRDAQRASELTEAKHARVLEEAGR